MPVFEIESGGGKFQVDAPDQATALAALQAHQTPEAETTLAGLGKSALSGVVGGVADLAGLPADVLGLTGIKGSEDFQKAYGGEALRQGITNKTGYQFHKPEGFAESVASTAGSFLPNMIGGGAGLATKLATRVALPALAAETAGELTDQNPYAKVAGALAGGVAGLKAERFGSRVVTPNPMTPERQSALDILNKEGVQVPAGMATGSRFLKAAESEMGGARYADMIDRMNSQYTAAAINRLSPASGVRGETAWTPQVITRAEDNVGQVFNDVAKRNPVIPIDKRGADAMAKVADDFESLTGARSKLLDNVVKKIGNTGAAPAISGESYQALSSEIARLSRASSVPELKLGLSDIKSALDSAIERGLFNKSDLDQWRQARRDWHNILLLNKSVAGSPEAAAYGLITPAKLTQAIDGMKRGNYARGKGDFSELARAGNQIMKSFQDSGTSTRLRSTAIPAAVGAIVGGGLGSIPGAALGLLGPFIGGRTLMSAPVQKYLVNQKMAAAPTGGLLPTPLQGAIYAQLMQRPQPVPSGGQ